MDSIKRMKEYGEKHNALRKSVQNEPLVRDVCEWKEKPSESWIWITGCGHEVEDDDTTKGEPYCRWCGRKYKT